jgi:hypothetical protein
VTDISIPNTFTSGTTIDSSDMNDNLSAIATFLNSTGVHKYQNATIPTAAIVDGAVTTAKISDSNVTTAKIADQNVTTDKITDGSVSTDKLTDLAVTAAKIFAGTKGDILTSDGAARTSLAVGADGKVLAADSTASNGLTYISRMNVKIGNFASQAGTGTQAITGVGFTPKLVLFFSIASDSAGTASMFLGGMTATDQFNVSTLADASPDHHRVSTSDRAFSTLDSSGAYNRRFSFSAFGADGFTVNWSSAATGATIYYVAIG